MEQRENQQAEMDNQIIVRFGNSMRYACPYCVSPPPFLYRNIERLERHIFRKHTSDDGVIYIKRFGMILWVNDEKVSQVNHWISEIKSQ